MNGMILQAPPENKDIKLISKKGMNTKSEEGENLFENLIAKLATEEGESKNSNFLLGKLLNLSDDFANKGKIISEFSKGDLLKEETSDTLSLEDLFKVALALKNGESFSTESPTLKTALEDKSVITQFKEAKNIKELLNIADKNGLKVKNFEFLHPEAALNPIDKKIVQKITSEEIFKMIEPKLPFKETPLTQSVLSKIISQEKTNSINKEHHTTLASLLTRETIEKKTVPLAKHTQKIVKEVASLKTDIPVAKETRAETLKTLEKAPQPVLSTLLKAETPVKENISLQQRQTVKEEVTTKESKTLPNSLQAVLKKTAKKVLTEEPVLKTEKAPPAVSKIESIVKENIPLQKEPTLKTEIPVAKEVKIEVQKKLLKESPPLQQIATQKEPIVKTVTDLKNPTLKTETSETKEVKIEVQKILSKESAPLQQQQAAKDIADPKELKTVLNNIQEVQKKALTPKSVEKATKIEETTLVLEPETLKMQKSEKGQQTNFNTLLKPETLVKENTPLQQQTVKEEPILKAEAEVKETSSEKTTNIAEIKSDATQKSKDAPDIKKTFNTFAMEFKEKVEAYKAPLMKINMQLSPGNLGDVDVTLVSRGNNLQVTINSNANTLALFIQNQAEFKNSLVNMGFSDLQMNFGDKRGEERGQNHKQDGQPQADYHDSENEENTNGIDMLIPNYV